MLFLPLIDLPIAASYLGGFDYNATHFIRALNDGGFFDTLFLWVTFTGNGLFMALITIALYLAGARKEALVFALVLIVTTAIAFVLKYAIARPRPSDLGVTPSAQPSFPSAHAATAFAFATTLSYYHRKFSALLFAWAALIAFSRTYLGLHYVTDLVGGALLGIAISLFITRAAKRIDGEITRIANSAQTPTKWEGAAKLPLIFITQLLQIAHTLVRDASKQKGELQSP